MAGDMPDHAAAPPGPMFRLEQTFGRPLPEAPLPLLKTADGVYRADGLRLYGGEDIAERNDTFALAGYAPGDDNGGRGLLVSFQADDPRLYRCDLGSLDPRDFEVAAADYRVWLAAVLAEAGR